MDLSGRTVFHSGPPADDQADIGLTEITAQQLPSILTEVDAHDETPEFDITKPTCSEVLHRIEEETTTPFANKMADTTIETSP